MWVNCRLLNSIAVGRPVYRYECGLNWFLKITTVQNSLAFSRRLQVNDIIIIIIIIIIIEFLSSQIWLGNIHLSWDVVINRIRLGGLICSLKSFLQLNMCQELQIFAVVYMYWGAG